MRQNRTDIDAIRAAFTLFGVLALTSCAQKINSDVVLNDAWASFIVEATHYHERFGR